MKFERRLGAIHFSRTDPGYALILVIALIAIGIFMVIAFLDVTVVETREAGFRRQALKAFWYAEAGLHKGIFNVRQNANFTTPSTGTEETFDEGKYKFWVEQKTSTSKCGDLAPREICITSTGTFFDLSRTVQQKFRFGA